MTTTDLKQFVEDMQFGAMAVSVEGLSPVQYLNQVAAAQDDLQRCTLANLMREAVERDGLTLDYGAYDYLLEQL